MKSHQASFVLLAMAMTLAHTSIAFVSPVAQVDSRLLATLEAQRSANIFITMRDQFDVSSFRTRSFASRGDQITALRDALDQFAEHSQKPVTEFIQSTAAARSLQFATRSFWISNQVFVKDADSELVQSLLLRNDVARIEEEVTVYLNDPKVSDADATSPGTNASVLANQWGIEKVRAGRVWNMANGTTGERIIVGVIDTGARYTHDILRNNYANDGFSWFDPVTRRDVPHDDNGHGTHCTGTAVGANGYGVAPGAKWISCKAFNLRGEASVADILSCFEFMFCPTSPSGSSKNCTKAPHVVNNSWSFKLGDFTGFNSAINQWHNAGIVPVFANGNEGEQGCGTVGSPADQNVIAVGATTENDALAIFSSKGPTTRGGTKPDISAPGHYINSASHLGNSEYKDLSGTSMASPHVTGVIALLLSYKQGLNYAEVKDILQRSTERRLAFSSEQCGSPDSLFPNNRFGYGRIDAYAAVQLADDYKGGASRVGFDMAVIVLVVVLLKQIVM